MDTQAEVIINPAIQASEPGLFPLPYTGRALFSLRRMAMHSSFSVDGQKKAINPFPREEDITPGVDLSD